MCYPDTDVHIRVTYNPMLTISTPDGRERTVTAAEVTSAYPHLATFERYAQKIRREAWKQLEASGKLPFA